MTCLPVWAINLAPFMDEFEHNSRAAEGYEKSYEYRFTKCHADLPGYGKNSQNGQ